MARLEGKVAFLTGAGAGIAKATAKAFVREGARVAIFELNRETGERAEREIRAAGGDALFVAVDVTKEDSVRQGVDAVISRYGRLDVIMNCAGGSLQKDINVHELDLELWHQTMALNLLHPFLCSKYAIPHLIKAGGGSIINFASHLGQMGSERPAYAAAKGGIVALTRTMAALYVENGIRVNAIAPGSVRTERWLGRYGNQGAGSAQGGETRSLTARQVFQKNYPFSIGDPEDIAAVAVFLASDESRMLTGTTICADGGRSSYLKVTGG